MARLIISSPGGKHGVVELSKPVITVGRGSANDVVLNDGSVSRFHAVIKQSGESSLSIADRGSTNGVFVDGVLITGETPLLSNSHVKIGIYDLKLEAMPEEALVVEKAAIPSALRDVLEGHALQEEFRPAPAAHQKALPEELAKLTKENFLLRLLYDAGKALNGRRTVDELVKQVVELAFRIEGVERGTIMFLSPDNVITEQSEVRYRNTPPESQPQISFSRTILQRILKEREPILVTDLRGDDRFAGSESIKISGMQSAMCAPLIGPNDGRMLGILYVDNLSRTAAFSQEELNVLAVVASQAGAAIDGVFAHKRLTTEAVQRQALERFLSPEVVEMIAANPEGIRLGGTNQKVTILFCDIRGFTPMSEQLPPEKIVEILNEYFSRVTDVIFDHGGTLDKYIGDAAMALFGAPISKGNDAHNAVNAALEIQKMITELNRDAADRGHPQLHVGIGINTGVVTAGNIGSAKRLDYTVIGDAVNLSSRLCGQAPGGQVWLSESTAHEVSGAFELEPLPATMVKGKSQPLKVFAVKRHASVSV